MKEIHSSRATNLSLISNEVAVILRMQCPKIVVPAKAGNKFTFFRGSASEKTVSFSALISKTKPDWRLMDTLTEKRPWSIKINPSWMNYEIEMIINGVIASLENYHTKIDQENIYRIIKRSRFLTWGVPIDSSRYLLFLSTLYLSCVKKSIPDDIWRLACKNAGNIFSLNDQVLSDALQEQYAYHTLYEIHPLLGRAWIPHVRSFVEETVGVCPSVHCYAEQLKNAMRIIGITRSGMRTLHRIAEKEPRSLYTVFTYLINGRNDGNGEMVSLLNTLNGNKPAGSFRRLFHIPWVYSENLSQHSKDILVVNQINWWLKNDFRYDKGLIYDWMRWMIIHRKGSLWRGFSDVTKQMKSSLQRKNAALAWANRSQRNWHLRFNEEI